MGLKLGQVEDLKKKLSELPEIHDTERQVSKQEAIGLLADEVRELQERGYSLERIATILSENGLSVSLSTLKSYLTKARKPSAQKSRRQVAKLKSPSATPQMATRTPEKLKGPLDQDNTRDGSSTSVRSSSFAPRRDTPKI